LIPYTERHYSHADELLKKSYVIGFTLHRMNELLGGADMNGVNGGGSFISVDKTNGHDAMAIDS
jgi:hypothetical protein